VCLEASFCRYFFDEVSSDNAVGSIPENLMSEPDREIRLRLSVQRALLGSVSSTLAAVTCGWNGNEVVLEFLVDPHFSDDDRELMEVVASEVVSDFGEGTIITVFTSPPSDGPKVPVDKRWWVYKRFGPDATPLAPYWD